VYFSHNWASLLWPIRQYDKYSRHVIYILCFIETKRGSLIAIWVIIGHHYFDQSMITKGYNPCAKIATQNTMKSPRQVTTGSSNPFVIYVNFKQL